MKVCIFSGTFNPIHKAHLEMAQYVLDNYNFDEILFIPAYKPPHKNYDENLSLSRLEMVKLAVKINPKFKVSDIEFKRNGKSYTYLTILELYKNLYNCKNPENIVYDCNFKNKISMIIGSDAFEKIETWYETDKLKKLVDFIVFVRENNNVNFDYLKDKGYNFKFANMKFIDISSTELRERIKNSESIDDLVTKEVEEYIYKNGLYRN